MKKTLPIGTDNFRKLFAEYNEAGELIVRPSYYMDKTLFVKEVLDQGAEVILYTRPRRFGKSLNLSMLQYYFENLKADNAHIFDGLKITLAGDFYQAHQNKYPVIKLTLKDVESVVIATEEHQKGETDFFWAYRALQKKIIAEFKRHNYLLESEQLQVEDKVAMEQILIHQVIDIKGETLQELRNKRTNYLKETIEIFSTSLTLLSELLHKHWGEKVIILIDEYDVPLEKAYFAQTPYYDEMASFMRIFYSGAMKSNNSLKFAVLTGCLRVSKESIFTGIHSALSEAGDEFFGFTEEEVMEMFRYYEKEGQLDTARNWYNGYLFGNTTVYNPWSLNRYVTKIYQSVDQFPEAYWANTSSNSIIRELIDEADEQTISEIEHLMAGGTIEKPIHEDVVYAEIKQDQENLWNFLFFTGYLKAVSKRREGARQLVTLTIPNVEVLSIYQRQIREWFDEKVKDKEQFTYLYEALLAQDRETLTDEITEKLGGTISYFDGTESFYHGFMAGILIGIPKHRVVSNRESGNGRPDIIILPTSRRKAAYVIEFKVSKSIGDLEKDAKQALQQIHDLNYTQEARHNGYEDVKTFGIAFLGKDCYVVN